MIKSYELPTALRGDNNDRRGAGRHAERTPP